MIPCPAKMHPAQAFPLPSSRVGHLSGDCMQTGKNLLQDAVCCSAVPRAKPGIRPQGRPLPMCTAARQQQSLTPLAAGPAPVMMQSERLQKFPSPLLPLDARLLQGMETAARQMLCWLLFGKPQICHHRAGIMLTCKKRMAALRAQACRGGPRMHTKLWLLKWKVKPICAHCSKDGARAYTQRLLRPTRCPFPKVSIFSLLSPCHGLPTHECCTQPCCTAQSITPPEAELPRACLQAPGSAVTP